MYVIKLILKYSLLVLFSNFFGLSNSVLAASDTKSEIKKIKSWNLKEWLEQKERNKMMGMWLVMHTPSPYEFALSYSHIGATQTLAQSDTEIEYNQFNFMAYASLVGLELQREQNGTTGYQDIVGLFHFRPFGVADQATHLTLSFGQKTRQYYNSTGETLRRQSFGQADLTIYFNDHFGIQGLYRGYMPIEDDPNWGSVTASQYEVGAFIDFEFLRVFINYIHEIEIKKLNAVKTDFKLEGYKSGLKLYF
jgi:hypothetical protein